MRFLCDAMLGGLARWLRAAGYDAEFEYGIADPELIARARRTGQLILSSDSGIFERNVIRTGAVPALYVPRDLKLQEQLAFVLETLHLPVREPRCMTCGGALLSIAKDEVRAEAPPRTFETTMQFWRCSSCGKLLWKGTHWARIGQTLDAARGFAASVDEDETLLDNGVAKR
ncbi:MAG: Mut7-C RNAse domain-containing protein [Polyangiaceae bacterium]|nr:Mut7-C RNAse domain-containing protein [Polyangiaceae bacterium]